MLVKKSVLLGVAASLSLTLFTGHHHLIRDVIADEVVPMYKPTLAAGAPTRRVGGGTRAAKLTNLPENLILAVVSPQSTGYTTSAQPVLYWSLSSTIDAPLEITLDYVDQAMSGNNYEPLLQTQIAKAEAGIYGISLGAHKLSLKPNVEYKWSVSIPTGNPANDVVSFGTIMLLDKPAGLADKLAKADDKQRPLIYAEAGLWYDAVTEFEALLKKYPDDTELRDKRNLLLEEVNLKVGKTGAIDVVVGEARKS
ncbi:DUF928 domain-containing protein [Beggiatoa leptomitoformis]|uniref:DUF928 domain-containing protein n=1 Tax=Beggiatoa leptomitoformis TaxID=288004 RepID=A0A2N9YD34_9GAMM|nr:DUF928 domain-containing protein [Beggiatoa leptomitoformis]ALG69198.1 DUF928 domain-containing protein [Beggiatoa leptomitoformis]AUI68371.1 DUF928 domain-containing protein [Beggiatoa leptomitoformis]